MCERKAQKNDNTYRTDVSVSECMGEPLLPAGEACAASLEGVVLSGEVTANVLAGCCCSSPSCVFGAPGLPSVSVSPEYACDKD